MQCCLMRFPVIKKIIKICLAIIGLRSPKPLPNCINALIRTLIWGNARRKLSVKNYWITVIIWIWKWKCIVVPTAGYVRKAVHYPPVKLLVPGCQSCLWWCKVGKKKVAVFAVKILYRVVCCFLMRLRVLMLNLSLLYLNCASGWICNYSLQLRKISVRKREQLISWYVKFQVTKNMYM